MQYVIVETLTVSGFLETLNERDRKKYKLFNNNINLAKNNAIETFFMERAAQLMKAGGVAGIVLPVSVLNKGGIYAKAREIILENFHIVSLVELGSGTFGKTGTNTVVMFLRRKETNTPDADHYTSRVECWFNLSENEDEVYQDSELMEKYCEHLGYAVDDYQEFLKGNLTETFLASEVVQTYHNSFFGNSRTAMKDVCDEAKNIRTKYVAKTKTATFRGLSDVEKQKEANKAFYVFVKAIEREKMYFFILAVQTENPVLLVKSPLPKKKESNEKIKKFLGYEWISRKGHEGIHYLNVNSETSNEDNDEGNEADDETMQEISGINTIVTPLFNPLNFVDETKINTIIRKSFAAEDYDIPEELSDFVTTARLIDIIEFKLTAFNKQFKTSVNRLVEYKSKYPSIKLSEMCTDILAGGDRPDAFSAIQTEKYPVPVFSNGTTKNGLYGYTNNATITSPCVTISARGTLGYCVYHSLPFVPIVRLIVCIPNAKYNPLYLKSVLECIEFINEGSSTPQLSVPKIREYKLPDAPGDVQDAIVSEMSSLEKEIAVVESTLSTHRDNLDRVLENAHSKATIDLRLDNEQIFELCIGRRVLRSELKKDGEYEVYSANVYEPFGRVNASLLSDFTTPSVLWGIDGDWMVNHLPAGRPFHPTDHCGVIKVLDENIVLSKYLVYPLLKAGEHERFSRANRASTERIKALTIRVPSIEIQRETVAKVIEIENKIEMLRQQIVKCQSNKQSILDKYLK